LLLSLTLLQLSIFFFEVSGLAFEVVSPHLLFFLVGLGHYLAPGLLSTLEVENLLLGKIEQRALRTDTFEGAGVELPVVHCIFFTEQTAWSVNPKRVGEWEVF